MSITFTDEEWEIIESLRQQGLDYLKRAEKMERQFIIQKRVEEYGRKTNPD